MFGFVRLRRDERDASSVGVCLIIIIVFVLSVAVRRKFEDFWVWSLILDDASVDDELHGRFGDDRIALMGVDRLLEGRRIAHGNSLARRPRNFGDRWQSGHGRRRAVARISRGDLLL